MGSLPVVDIAAFRHDPFGAAAATCVEQMLQACHETGFVYITGHGIDTALDTALFDTANSFFALPLEQRQSLAIENSAAFRGYTTLGDERTNGQADWREQLDVGPEEVAPTDLSGPAWHRLRGPNQRPANLPAMRPAVDTWMDEMEVMGVEAIELPAELAAHSPGGSHAKIDDEIHALFGENNLRTRLRSHPELPPATMQIRPADDERARKSPAERSHSGPNRPEIHAKLRST